MCVWTTCRGVRCRRIYEGKQYAGVVSWWLPRFRAKVCPAWLGPLAMRSRGKARFLTPQIGQQNALYFHSKTSWTINQRICFAGKNTSHNQSLECNLQRKFYTLRINQPLTVSTPMPSRTNQIRKITPYQFYLFFLNTLCQ